MRENLKSVLKTGAILLTVGFICTLILSLCNHLTKDRIAELTAEKEKQTMVAVLPDAQTFDNVVHFSEGAVIDIFAGKENGEIIGYCVKTNAMGYGGAISMMVGVNKDCTVSGVEIISMSETPGLGARANDKKFVGAYAGKTLGVSVKKSGAPGENEVSAISGATITSKAITNGVNSALQAVNKILKGGAK